MIGSGLWSDVLSVWYLFDSLLVKYTTTLTNNS